MDEQQMLDGIRQVAEGLGFRTTTTMPTPVALIQTFTEALGAYVPSTRTLWVDEALEPRTRLAVWLHELTHALAAGIGLDRWTEEGLCDAVAIEVLRHYDLDSTRSEAHLETAGAEERWYAQHVGSLASQIIEAIDAGLPIPRRESEEAAIAYAEDAR